jgi:cysteine-S-conjugate beta-lyase
LLYDFDRIIDRQGTNSLKWKKYPANVLPLWVADMDFAVPEPILAALRSSVEHSILGYEMPTDKLLETVAERMRKLYGWQVSPDWVIATPGIVSGFNIAAQAVCSAGQGLLIQPPVYPPFLDVHKNAGLVRQDAPLVMTGEGHTIQYSVDFDVFESAVHSNGAKTGLFLLCNPHNPTGQVYSRSDLARMAEICLKNEMIVCSDEIHSELLLGGARHIPIATLSPDIAKRSITLIAPSKTFNVPGLFCGFAIVPDEDIRERYKKTADRLTMHVSSLGLIAAQAAFSGGCDDWLAALCTYLTGNRDFLVDYVRQEFEGMRTSVPDATYLSWLDCNPLVQSGRITGVPSEYFLKTAKVALNNGSDFGPGGEGFVRLNFGCSRAILVEALERMKTALGL